MDIKVVRRSGDVIAVEVHEGDVWPSIDVPRPSITVEVFYFERYGRTRTAEVTWPSTSDKRPELALALARALERAALVAGELDECGDTRFATRREAAERNMHRASDEDSQRARIDIALLKLNPPVRIGAWPPQETEVAARLIEEWV